MSDCAELIEEIEKSGGRVWVEGKTLRGERIPRRLLERMREQKDGIITELQKVNVVNIVNIVSGLSPSGKNSLCGNQCPPNDGDYDLAEREAIQTDSELPPFTPEELDPHVPGFDDVPSITLAVHHQNALRAAGCMMDTTPSSSVASRAVSGPSSGMVQCRDCLRFMLIAKIPRARHTHYGTCSAYQKLAADNCPSRCPDFLSKEPQPC